MLRPSPNHGTQRLPNDDDDDDDDDDENNLMARVISTVSVMADPVMLLSILFFILVASLKWISATLRSVRQTTKGSRKIPYCPTTCT